MAQRVVEQPAQASAGSRSYAAAVAHQDARKMPMMRMMFIAPSRPAARRNRPAAFRCHRARRARRRLLLAPTHPRIVQQHRHVPLAQAQHRVLEVEQANALYALALRQPDEVSPHRCRAASVCEGNPRFGDQVAHPLPAQPVSVVDAHVEIALGIHSTNRSTVAEQRQMIERQHRPFAAAIRQCERRGRAHARRRAPRRAS